MDISEIKTVFVEWSESALINERLGADEFGDIDKYVDPVEFSNLVTKAAPFVGGGYDKTQITVEFVGGEKLNKKLYLTEERNTLIKLICG
tara:strand:- start:50 stop:319 length:270 start_codon:yes stop_codon:yes gene_type:complete